MRLNWKFLRPFGFGRITNTVLAVFLALQMLVLLMLVACPELHHALHPDSDKADHDCLVTAFVKSTLNEAELTPVVVLFAVFVIYAVMLPKVLPRSLFRYSFSASRAPPRF